MSDERADDVSWSSKAETIGLEIWLDQEELQRHGLGQLMSLVANRGQDGLENGKVLMGTGVTAVLVKRQLYFTKRLLSESLQREMLDKLNFHNDLALFEQDLSLKAVLETIATSCLNWTGILMEPGRAVVVRNFDMDVFRGTGDGAPVCVHLDAFESPSPRAIVFVRAVQVQVEGIGKIRSTQDPVAFLQKLDNMVLCPGNRGLHPLYATHHKSISMGYIVRDTDSTEIEDHCTTLQHVVGTVRDTREGAAKVCRIIERAAEGTLIVRSANCNLLIEKGSSEPCCDACSHMKKKLDEKESILRKNGLELNELNTPLSQLSRYQLEYRLGVKKEQAKKDNRKVKRATNATQRLEVENERIAKRIKTLATTNSLVNVEIPFLLQHPPSPSH